MHMHNEVHTFCIYLRLNLHKSLKTSLTLCMLAVTCCLLIALANSLDHDQDEQNIDPPFDTLIVFLKEIYENSEQNKCMENYPACKELNLKMSQAILLFPGDHWSGKS